MATAEAQNPLKQPSKLKSPPEKRDWEKYCQFHRDHGHNTEDCFRLKMAIEKLIERGHLADLVANDRQPRQAVKPLEQQQALENINVVSGRTLGGGDYQSARKRYVRTSRANIGHVQTADHLPSDTLTFLASDI